MNYTFKLRPSGYLIFGIFSLIAVGCLLLGRLSITNYLGIAVTLTLYFAACYAHTKIKVIVNEFGFTRTYPFGTPVTLKWDDIDSSEITVLNIDRHTPHELVIQTNRKDCPRISIPVGGFSKKDQALVFSMPQFKIRNLN